VAATKPPDDKIKERQATEERLAERAVVAMNGWRQLTRKPDGSLADPATAANTAESIGAQKFWDNLMVDATGSVSADYWTKVTRLGLDLLARACPDRGVELTSLLGGLNQFPIVAPRAGDRPLTAAAVGQLRAAVAAYLARVAAADAGRAYLAGKSVPPWFTAAYAKIVARSPDAGGTRQLRRAQLILDACGGEVRFATVPLAVQQVKAGAAGAAGAARLQPTFLTLIRLQGNEWPKAYPDPAPANVNDGNLGTVILNDSADNGLKFEMREAGPYIPLERTNLKKPVQADGPWAPLRLLYQYTAQPDPIASAPDQATTWYVELPQPNFPRPGQTTAVWVKVVFPKPLPVTLK
jgi:hypothetical protein